MKRERAELGFGEALNDLAEFGRKPKEAKKPKLHRNKTRTAAEAAGFRSRESKISAPPRQPRRHRTGRNVQFNIKAKPEMIEMFCRVSDANGWSLGETLEYAVALLVREHGS